MTSLELKGRKQRWFVLSGPISGYTVALYEAIVSRGAHEVTFWGQALPKREEFQHEQFTLSGVNLHNWSDLTSAQIWKTLRDTPPDVVILYGTQPRSSMALALLALPRRVPLVFFSDANVACSPRSALAQTARAFAYEALATRVAAVACLGITNEWAQRGLGLQKTVQLPLCPVNFGLWGDAAGGDGRTTDSRKTVLTIVARLDRIKNVVPTLRGIAARDELRDKIEVRVAGAGPEREALDRLAASSSLTIKVLGSVSRSAIGGLLADSDALLLPSQDEPWGIVVTEALGMGIPVVATPAVGAAVSLAGTTQAVLLAESAEPSAIADAVEMFLERKAPLQVAAQAAASHVRSWFDTQRVADRLIALAGRLTSE